MGYFSSLDVSASGLTAQRLRMDTISQNIANINTTRTEDGTPYRRKVTLFEERVAQPGAFGSHLLAAIQGDSMGLGVRVARILQDDAPFKRVYEPGHPDADEDGYVSLPNVEVITEMVNMISATRSYEANVTSINATKAMCMKALEIGR